MKLPAGSELIAHWREAGAWWLHEPPLEVVEWRDARGVRRRRSRRLPPLSPEPNGAPGPYREDHTEEVSLRPRKARDEKVARACGYAPAVPEVVVRRGSERPYVPLHAMSGYAFGRSLLFAEEIPRHAAELGLPAVALADPFSLTGAVEFVHECRRVGVAPLVGASFEMAEGGELVLITRDRTGYRSLSRLITACHLGEPRLFPLCDWDRLERHAEGLLCLTGGDAGLVSLRTMAGRTGEASAALDRLIGLYGREHVFVEVERSYLPWQHRLERRLRELAERHGLTAVAGGAITHRHPEQFPAQDVLVCAHSLCAIEEVVGRKPRRDPSQPQVASLPLRSINAERRLRSAAEMRLLYRDAPELLDATLRVAEACEQDVLPARTELPLLYDDPDAVLRAMTLSGASLRHPKLERKMLKRLDYELHRIARLGFANHFLVAWDACRWAGDQGILYSGRGSVVDSAVAYCLGFSRIDAYAHRLHFDRFLPADGSKRPDIDIDFEARRRDDVRQYLTDKYGRDHVATIAAIGAYNTRGIVREVGKVLSLSPDAVGYLAKKLHGSVCPHALREAIQARPELRDSDIPLERFQWLFSLAAELTDVPRNMRAHSSGIIISAEPLCDTVPIQLSGGEAHLTRDDALSLFGDPGETDVDIRIAQWDKRSAKHFFDKFDVLCLRGQDVLSGLQERVRLVDPDFRVDALPVEDENALRAMRAGETIGIPQSASPAMRQAHQRIQTQNLHDASLVQAGIRPGVGGAVKINELIARRRGLKPYDFAHPKLEKILGHTYGIVVFQEQIDLLLQECCGYSSGKAEEIREKIHKLRRVDFGQEIEDELLSRCRAQGLSQIAAEHVFELIAGFKGYGFAQGHALAFAEISLRSVYCQQNFPAEYFASILSAQPAGYYGPCTLANEARARGVAILPLDVNRSEERFSVEDVRSRQDPKLLLPNGGVRVALSQVTGLSRQTRERLVSARAQAPFSGLVDFCIRAEPQRDELEALVLAGGFDSLVPNRRGLLWLVPQAMASARRKGGALRLPTGELAPDPAVPDFSHAERALHERAVLGLDVERHLMAFERERVRARGGITSAEARRLGDREKAIVVGNPIRLRFPPTASGRRVVFFDLEDETGLLNVTCFDETYRRDGHAIVCSPYVTLVGKGQWRDGHVTYLAERVFPYRPEIARLLDQTESPALPTADFLVG